MLTVPPSPDAIGLMRAAAEGPSLARMNARADRRYEEVLAGLRGNPLPDDAQDLVALFNTLLNIYRGMGWHFYVRRAANEDAVICVNAYKTSDVRIAISSDPTTDKPGAAGRYADLVPKEGFASLTRGVLRLKSEFEGPGPTLRVLDFTRTAIIDFT